MNLRAHRQRLLDWVRGQLIGPAGTGSVLGSPAERYSTGVLHLVDPGGFGMTGLDPAQSEKDDDGTRRDPGQGNRRFRGRPGGPNLRRRRMTRRTTRRSAPRFSRFGGCMHGVAVVHRNLLQQGR